MKNRLKALAVLMLAGALVTSAGKSASGQTRQQGNLWAAVGVAKPVFRPGEGRTIAITFAVVNDGATTVDPLISSTRLLVNGNEQEDWAHIAGNGLRGPDFTALPPGQLLLFAYDLGKYFVKPGIYSVQWFGPNFKTSEITFRVM
jgi:hypothetical protein